MIGVLRAQGWVRISSRTRYMGRRYGTILQTA